MKNSQSRNGLLNIFKIISYFDKEASTLHDKFGTLLYLRLSEQLYLCVVSYSVLVS